MLPTPRKGLTGDNTGFLLFRAVIIGHIPMFKQKSAEAVIVFLVTSIFWVLVLTPLQRSDTHYWKSLTNEPVALFTLVLDIATIALWVATYYLYVAARTQSRIAIDAITAEHRAWLVTELLIKSDLTADRETISIGVVLKYTNFGRTAALRCSTQLKMAFFEDGGNVADEVKELANEHLSQDSGDGIDLPPNQSYERRWYMSVARPNFERYISRYGEIEETVFPIIIGSVTYGLFHDASARRQTAFAYLLKHKSSSEWVDTPIPIGRGDIRQKDIRVEIYSGGFFT